MVEQVWDFGLFDGDIKEDLILRVSKRCMISPGMTDQQLKIAIGEELATCQEWNSAFQSLVESTTDNSIMYPKLLQ